jgi:dihydropteroate synthase
MGIVNVTPDSFSDGGRLATPESAAEFAARLALEGAAVLDVGGESTRPGSLRVDASEQIRRVVPAIRAIRARLPFVAISIDTTLAPVARAALDAGADSINDVSGATEDPSILALAAERRAGLVLMHRLRPPGEDSYSDRYPTPPSYTDVVLEVRDLLRRQSDRALHSGVARESIILDPGLGFGKSVEHNAQLIRRTPELLSLGFPILSGLSRKSFVGRLGLGRDSTPDERLPATLAASLEHQRRGARLFRVHDVAAHASAFRAAGALAD